MWPKKKKINKRESEMAQEEVILELIPELVLVMEALPLFLRACSQPHPMLVAGDTKILKTLAISPVTIEQKSLLSPKALLSLCTLCSVFSSLIIVASII